MIALLTKEPNARVRITLEISAEFPEGASESTKRSVSENASTLKFDRQEWE